MIIEPVQPFTLKDGSPLWRYMRLSTFMLLLESKAFFPSVSTLRSGDPLEGDLMPEPEWLMGKLLELAGTDFANLEQWLLDRAGDWKGPLEKNPDDGSLRTSQLVEVYVCELAKRRAVWCWHHAEGESAAMWSLYGYAGIALGTSLGNLKAALPQDVPFQIAEIKYAERNLPCSPSYFDPEEKENEHRIHRPHLVKGQEYEHENEVRVITDCHPSRKGRFIRNLNAGVLIREVVVSPLIPSQEAEAIESQITRHDWPERKPLIRRSSILGRKGHEEKSMRPVLQKYAERVGEVEVNLPRPFNQL
jgi:hypothetical protein